MDMQQFGQRIKDLRMIANKSQETVVSEMYNKTGVSITAQTYGRYERGDPKHKPDIEILSALATYYDVSSDYLLGLADVQTNNGDIREFCYISGLTEKSANMLLAQFHSQEFNRLLECFVFEDLLSILFDMSEQSKMYLDQAQNNELISKIETDYIDLYRYRAHKVFDIILDEFDERKINEELAQSIKCKTDEHQRNIYNTIGKLKAKHLSTSSNEEREEIKKHLAELSKDIENRPNAAAHSDGD